MYLSIILIPLITSIFAGLFGRKLGAQGSQFITTFGLIVTACLSFTAFYEVGLNSSSVSVDLFSWIDSEYFLVSWGFTFDSLTVSMLIPIVFISSLVHMYSISYMGADPVKCFGKTFLFGIKLPNSGEPLKLMIPSYSRKAISGWNNYPCMVTSHKIDERKIGNRGSKSEFQNSVKEQRVYGSWCIAKNNPMHLRCTLMGFERNYPIKIPSNQLNCRKFSTLNNSSYINPWFWTGLIDGEGSFSVIISYLIIFITENYYQDSVNFASFLTIYSFIPFFILYTDKNSQDIFYLSNKESKVSAVIVYSNIDTDKSKILSENKGKAGIYQWTHLESGKFYIGSAVDLSKRLKDYFSKAHLERSKTRYINNAILSHGYSAFSLSILEYIDISNLSKKETRKLILSREQFYFDCMESEYNILKIAGSSLGYIHTEETKLKMSEALIGENHPQGMLGKSHTIETILKISKAQKDINKTGENHHMFGITGEKHHLFGKSHSAESIAKMSLAHSGKTLSKETKDKISLAKGKPIYVYSSDKFTLINTLNSARKAGEFFDVSRDIIIRYARKEQIFRDKWILSYTLK